MRRHAFCSCGQLHLTCEGEPVRVSICHCDACQKRTGGVFGTQARFRCEQVSSIEGRATAFTRTADSGSSVTFHFCLTCGGTLYWHLGGYPDVIAVAVGAFADPSFPAPKHSVYEARRHAWVQVPDGVEHLD